MSSHETSPVKAKPGRPSHRAYIALILDNKGISLNDRLTAVANGELNAPDLVAELLTDHGIRISDFTIRRWVKDLAA